MSLQLKKFHMNMIKDDKWIHEAQQLLKTPWGLFITKKAPMLHRCFSLWLFMFYGKQTTCFTVDLVFPS